MISLKVNLPDITILKRRKVSFDKIKNLSGTMYRVGRRLLFVHRLNIVRDKKDQTTGQQWAITKRIPSRFGILIRTGKLASGFLISQSRNTVSIKNTVSYAKYHQDGTSKMPRRRILGLSRQEQGFLVRMIRKDIRDLVQNG